MVQSPLGRLSSQALLQPVRRIRGDAGVRAFQKVREAQEIRNPLNIFSCNWWVVQELCKDMNIDVKVLEDAHQQHFEAAKKQAGR